MILLKGCYRAATGIGRRGGAAGADLSGVDILVEGNRITRIASSIQAPPGARVIDASRHVVLPGLVNCHHHFYQTLTRALPAVQEAKLFDWLVYLYEIWKGLDEEAVYWSSRLALAELVKTGCTLASDHHYLYPSLFKDDIPSIQFEAASDIGIRFAPTRGSMSRSKKDGGLPPDSVVQDEETILAESAAAIDRYHDPAPDAMRKLALAPCSPFSVSEKAMADAAELARAKGVRLHTHLAETLDEERFCLKTYGVRPVGLMEELGWLGPDVWFAHVVHVNEAEIARLAETGTGVAHCPSSNMRLGSGIAPIVPMLQAGVPVGLAVDGSASNDSSHMLAEARQALLLQRVRYGAGALSVSQALELATLGGAPVLGRDDIGALAPGKAADLIGVRLDRLAFAGAQTDPLAALLFCTPPSVDLSVINGRVVVEGGHLLGVDLSAIVTRHNEIARSLVERAAG